MYKLFTDKQEVFEAQIELEGASIDNSFARLILESKKLNLVFKGSVDSNGDVKIPIHKLKNILKEGDTGKITLEVIAEDVYFNPWESEFEVDTSKKLTVEVKSQDDKEVIKEEKEQKPKITLKEVKDNVTPEDYVNEYINLISKQDVYSQNDFNLLTESFIEKKKMNLDTQKEFYTLLKTLL